MPAPVRRRRDAAGDVFEQAIQQAVQFREHHAAARVANFLRKVADRAVGLRQRGVAQEQARRKALDGAAHHAVGVLRLDLAVDLDPQFLERPVGGEDMGDIAEGVFVGGEPRIGHDVDAPAPDVLAFVVARRQPQHLDHAGGGRIVAVDRAMGDAKAHVGRQRTDDGGQIGSTIDQAILSVLRRLSSVVR